MVDDSCGSGGGMCGGSGDGNSATTAEEDKRISQQNHGKDDNSGQKLRADDGLSKHGIFNKILWEAQSGDPKAVRLLLRDPSLLDKTLETAPKDLPAPQIAVKRNNLTAPHIAAKHSNIKSIDDPKRKLDEFEKELEKIVGLHNLKTKLRRWAKGMIMDDKRRSTGLDLGPRKRPHMAFLGNPGTGKTTIARIMGKLLHSTGVLSGQKVIEVQRTDLVAGYIGHTGPKTRKKITEAKGGILFVDEAYRLSSELGYRDFGLEALEEIMSVLEDDDIVVIFAGYKEPMKRLLDSNPGFYRRVPHVLQFEDYSCRDLAEMLVLKMTGQDRNSCLYGFKLDESCDVESVLAVIEKGSSQELRVKMNGGLVDHMLNNARESLDSRLSLECGGDELFTITLADLEAGLRVLAEGRKVN